MEDSQIVQLYWDRNERAILVTAEKYGNYCMNIARNILENKEDAEECINDTYLHAWNAMPPHKPKILSTFLGKITRNLSFNRFKYNHAEKRRESELPMVLDELSECVSGTANVEMEIEYKELVNEINTFLRTLSLEKRCIFIRRYWYADSISEIAYRLEMKEGAVTMNLKRLRIKLQKYLNKRGFVL